MRHYSEHADGTIEYIDRAWFVERLVDKCYQEAAGNGAENEKYAESVSTAYEDALNKMDDEQLAQEYADRIGDPKDE